MTNEGREWAREHADGPGHTSSGEEVLDKHNDERLERDAADARLWRIILWGAAATVVGTAALIGLVAALI